MDTTEYGQMLKTILILKKMPERSTRGWKMEGETEESPGKCAKGWGEELEVGGSVAQNGLWNNAKKRMLT